MSSDCRNRRYNKSASLRCGGKWFHSPGLAAAKAVLLGSRLDYANSLLYGTTQKNINWLQRVQNTFARVIAGRTLPQDTRTSGILKHLHWLPIENA